jgi:4-amino-4-deoxy-L-arabinose transferase-like glycosyltransferase
MTHNPGTAHATRTNATGHPARLLAVLIVLLGAALRIAALERVPPGLLSDEASNAYDAYLLWHTGRDQHGALLPTAIRAFNDYRGPAFAYSMAPIVGPGGLTVFGARLTAAFWGTLAIAAAYWAGRTLFDEATGAGAALLLAISPWHVPLSRLAHEGNTTVLTAALFVGCFWRWQRRPGLGRLVTAAVVAGLGLYTYSVMKLFLPLMTLALALLFWRKVWAHRRHVALAALLGLALAAPLAYRTLRYPAQMQARYRQITIFQPDSSMREALPEALRTAWVNVSPDYLFGRGDRDATHHPPGLGQLYPVQAALILAGIGWGLSHPAHRKALAATGLWIVASTVPTAFITMPPGWGQSLRALPAVIPWQMLSALGLAGLWHLLRGRIARIALGGATCGWIALNALGYFGAYFTRYPLEAPARFEPQMPALIAAVDALAEDYSTVYFTCNASYYAYVKILFFTRHDPHAYQRAPAVWRNDGLFAPVERLGKYRFVCDIADVWATGAPGLYVALPGELPTDLPGATLQTTWQDAQGRSRYTIAARRFFPYPVETLAWFQQCTRPTAPIPPDLMLQGAPGGSLRRIDFDCTSAWLYPASATAGAYALHRDLLDGALRPQDPFADRHLGASTPAFTNTKRTEAFPAFVIYDAAAPAPPPATPRACPAPAAAPPAAPDDTCALPLTLDGPLTFLGAKVYPGGGDLEIETWWRVTQGPVERNFSIMAHLLDAGGESLGVADGLGVYPVTLLDGDVVVQRHRFSGATTSEARWLRTGAYWLDDGARWTVAGVPAADAIFVPLSGGTSP